MAQVPEWIRCDGGIVRLSNVIAIMNPNEEKYSVIDTSGREYSIDRAAWVWFTKDLNRLGSIGPPQSDAPEPSPMRRTLQQMADAKTPFVKRDE